MQVAATELSNVVNQVLMNAKDTCGTSADVSCFMSTLVSVHRALVELYNDIVDLAITGLRHIGVCVMCVQ